MCKKYVKIDKKNKVIKSYKKIEKLNLKLHTLNLIT